MMGPGTRLPRNPPPVPYFIDQKNLHFRPLVPSHLMGFLPAMVEAGNAIYSDEWQHAETRALLSPFNGYTNPANNQALDRIKNAFAWLATVLVDGAVPSYFWYQGMHTQPQPLNAALISSNTDNLMRQGYIWRERKAHFVLVDTIRFRSALVAAGKARETSVDGLHLSSDMQLAVAVSREVKPGDGHPHTIPSLTARITELANERGAHISKRRAQEIARIVYDPELKKGAR